MRKATIFKYELKRLLLSKEYLLLLAAVLAYGMTLLRSLVMYGVSFTAPFSRLTFSSYCAALAPLLFILLLVLCARQTKASERGAEAIIGATPMPLHVFRLLRYGAVAGAFLIPLLLSVLLCLAFYALVFDYTAFGVHLWSSALLLLPPAVLIFGAASYLGQKRAWVVFVLLAAILVIGVFQIGLPSWLDLTGSSVAASLNAPPQETWPLSFQIGRAAFLAAGILLTAASLGRNVGKRSTR